MKLKSKENGQKSGLKVLKAVFKTNNTLPKQHFNIWYNILELSNNHILPIFYAYAAYIYVSLVSAFSFFFVIYPSHPSVF